MSARRSMLRRVTAFVSALTFLVVSNYSAVGAVYAQAITSKSVTADVTARAPEDGSGQETPGNDTPSDSTPSEGKTGDETPSDETPGDETPGDETPGDETPGDETPGDETPGDETPGDETPGDETPGDETPGDEEPGDQEEASLDIGMVHDDISDDLKKAIDDQIVVKVKRSQQVKNAVIIDKSLHITFAKDADPNDVKSDVAKILASESEVEVNGTYEKIVVVPKGDDVLGSIEVETYYRFNDYTGLLDAAEELKEILYNSKGIRANTELTKDMFVAGNNHHLESDKYANGASVTGAVTLTDEGVKIDDTTVFTIAEDTITLDITCIDTKVSLSNETYDKDEMKQFDVAISKLQDTWINIEKTQGEVLFINSMQFDSDVSLSVKDLLLKLGYIDNFKNGGLYTLVLRGSASKYSATTKFYTDPDDSEVFEEKPLDIFSTRNGNRTLLALPYYYIYDDGRIYYLASYSLSYQYYNANISTTSKTFEEADILALYAGKSLFYNTDVAVTANKKIVSLDLEYRPFSNQQDFGIEDFLRYALNNNKSDGVMRNDSTYAVNGPDSSISLKGESGSGIEKISENEQLSGKFEDTTPSRTTFTKIEPEEGDPYYSISSIFEHKNQTATAKTSFICYDTLLQSEDGKWLVTPMKQPIIFYNDTDAPQVEMKKNDTDTGSDAKKWSKTGSYELEFTVSDPVDKKNLDLHPEMEQYYEKIAPNPDLASIASIQVGELTFKRPSNGWRYFSSTDSTEGYSVELKQDSEAEGKFTFKAIVTPIPDKDTNKVEGFSDNIRVIATDQSGYFNAGDTAQQEVNVDTVAPKMSMLTVSSLTDGHNDENGHPVRVRNANNGQLTVSVNVSDGVSQCSGIAKDGVDCTFVDLDFPDRSISVKMSGQSGTYTATFNTNDIKNRRGILRITAEDNAGNDTERYYLYVPDAEGGGKDTLAEWSSVEHYATEIIIDERAPVVDEVEPSREADYYEDENNTRKAWYKTYPLIDLHANDPKDSAVHTEVKTLDITINGQTMNVEIPYDAENLYLQFEHDSDASKSFNVSLYRTDTNKAIAENIFEEALELGNEGELDVKVTAYDYAGNKSAEAGTTIYIDNSIPVIDPTFAADGANLRSFGTFANHVLTVKTSFNDSLGASSGIKSATIKFHGEKYEGTVSPDGEGKYIATFQIPKDVDEKTMVTGELEMEVVDNVGNVSNIVTLTSSLASKPTALMVESYAPIISDPAITGDHLYVNENGERWFSSDIDVQYTVEDEYSGIWKIDYQRPHEDAKDNDPILDDLSDVQKKKMTYPRSTDPSLDGKYTFTINATDNAGNEASKTIDVFKDVNAPYVTGFNFDATRYAADAGNDQANIVSRMGDRFAHFYQDAITMTVFVKDDRGASAGVKSINCTLYHPDGRVFDTMTVSAPKPKDGVYAAQFPVPEGFKGDIVAWAEDNVTNRSEDRSPDGYVSENQARHETHAVSNITLPETNHKDTNDLPLYDQAITAVLEAKDSFSGIYSVEWLTSDMNDWAQVVVDGNGQLAGDAAGWRIDDTERNIVKALSYDAHVTTNANNDFIRMRITDNSGNVTESETHFSIDTTIPTIAVTGLEKSNGGIKYYNKGVTARVTITERNFTSPDVVGGPSTDYAPVSGTLPETDGYAHSRTYSFAEDGNYSLSVQETDMAGNVSEKYESGQFVVDTKAPVLTLEFAKNGGGGFDPAKDHYVDSPVSATITVTDANFDTSNGLTISINDKSYPYQASDLKGGSSGGYTLSIPSSVFEKDGTYTVSVKGVDKAGNEATQQKASFTVDQVKPVIKSGGFSAANKGDVAPYFEVTDLNLLSQEISVSHYGKKLSFKEDKDGKVHFTNENGDVELIGSWKTSNSNGTTTARFEFEKFPMQDAYEGNYEIAVNATDRASLSEKKAEKFSVNRNGSTFEVAQVSVAGSKIDLNGKHINEAPTVVITETNVNEHKKGSKVVAILDKGSTTTTLSENDYTVSGPTALKDGSGYQYTYTFGEKIFDKDVDYKIVISTEDAAGNKNSSEKRGGELSFSLDTHEPEFTCENLVRAAEFRTSEQQFTLNVNEVLSHIVVRAEGGGQVDSLIDEDVDGSQTSFPFILPAANSSRSLVVELTDLANNTTTQTFDDLLVTENVALYLWHKTWVKATTGGILLAGLGTGAFLVIRKKRKES